jgi:hypothetical protein
LKTISKDLGIYLLIVIEGKIAKVEGEKLRTIWFEQWLINNPIEK